MSSLWFWGQPSTQYKMQYFRTIFKLEEQGEDNFNVAEQFTSWKYRFLGLGEWCLKWTTPDLNICVKCKGAKYFSPKCPVYQFVFRMSNFDISAVPSTRPSEYCEGFSYLAVHRNCWKYLMEVLHFWYRIMPFSLPAAAKDLAVCLSMSSKCVK